MAGLVMDTHAWIWLVLDDPELRPAARAGIAAAAAREELYLSVISVWEVAMLEARRRIVITAPMRDWVERALALPGLRVAGLTPEVAVASVHLPGRFHADPADRIIVATARRLEATLLTRDRRILAYGEQGRVPTMRA